jgi:hypothetical protein
MLLDPAEGGRLGDTTQMTTKEQRAERWLATLSRSIRNRFGTSDSESVMRTPRKRRR